MKISKAVITAAGRNQRTLPLQTLVDRDGVQKSVLAIIVEEVLRAGIEEICVVVCPGDEAAYAAAAGEHAAAPDVRPAARAARLRPRRLLRPRLRRRRAVPAPGRRPPLRQPRSQRAAPSSWSRWPQARPAPSPPCRPRARASCPTTAPSAASACRAARTSTRSRPSSRSPRPPRPSSSSIVPGLRAGHYLCFFGMHVLTPAVMEILAARRRRAAGRAGGSRSRAPLAELAAPRALPRPRTARAAATTSACRYGLLTAQLALALAGNDRDEVLAQLRRTARPARARHAVTIAEP